MAQISELRMADLFEEYIKSEKNYIARFDYVFREVSCIQGIPDFIAISKDSFLVQSIDVSAMSSAAIESSAIILSLLKVKSPRTFSYLAQKSGLQITTINKSINALESKGLVFRNVKNQLFLGENWIEPTTEIWAFELKMKNWKRALFQALQYKTFANRVVVVFPADKQMLLMKNIEIFRKLKVGVLIYDTEMNASLYLNKPEKLNPSSRSHNLFALSKLIAEIEKDQGTY